jgi:F-type H+-transporting ATPase subunit b
MEIIQQLGINGTALVQFGIFICIFFFLNFYLFKPYYKAVEERENRTLGGEDLALEIQQKTTELHSQYQIKAKSVSQKIKTIYDAQRSDALKEYDTIVGQARQQSASLLESNNQKIAHAIQGAAAQLHAESNQVAIAITRKLLGK